MCRVPVISTRVGGMADLLGNGLWGDLVGYSEDELRDCLEKRLEDLADKKSPAYRALKNRSDLAQKHFYRRFHLNRLVADVKKIYSRYLSAPTSLTLREQSRKSDQDRPSEKSSVGESTTPGSLPQSSMHLPP